MAVQGLVVLSIVPLQRTVVEHVPPQHAPGLEFWGLMTGLVRVGIGPGKGRKASWLILKLRSRARRLNGHRSEFVGRDGMAPEHCTGPAQGAKTPSGRFG